MVLLRRNKCRKWEVSLLVGVALAAMLGAGLGAAQDALAAKVVRLHVVANSDSEGDQALKLRVRDAVLAEITPRLAGLGRQEAEETLRESAGEVGETAARVVGEGGYTYPVRVSIREERFPTKRYEDFALPAGDYTALRIELGEGNGKNWWCVVFPPLCMSSVEEVMASTAAAEGLNGSDLALITGETQGYVVKFKAMELWEKLKARLS